MSAAFTPGPWVTSEGEIYTPSGLLVAFATNRNGDETELANARLISAAPDHALFASAVCRGAARWEPFMEQGNGEVCVGGLRYATELDEFGCPEITGTIRSALLKATGGAG